MPRASTADLVEAAGAAGRATAAFNVITLEHAEAIAAARAGSQDHRLRRPARTATELPRLAPGCRLVSNRSPSCCSVPSCSAGRWT